MWIGLSRVSVTINYTSLVANGHFNILYNSSRWGHIQMIYWYFTNNCIESMTLIYVPLMYLLHCLLYIYILSIINNMMNRLIHILFHIRPVITPFLISVVGISHQAWDTCNRILVSYPAWYGKEHWLSYLILPMQ